MILAGQFAERRTDQVSPMAQREEIPAARGRPAVSSCVIDLALIIDGLTAIPDQARVKSLAVHGAAAAEAAN